MPGIALSHLREELEIVEGEHRAKLMLYRYGQRCGRALVQSYGLSRGSISEVRAVIEPIWMEAGLSRMKVESAEDADMVVNLQESVEAKEGKTCDFARGYLSGIVSELTGKRFEVDEVECACSEGDLACISQAYEVVDTLKPSNKEEVETARKYNLESGYSYLIKGRSPTRPSNISLTPRSTGYRACASRGSTREGQGTDSGLKGIPFLWLSMDQEKDYSREPSNMALLYSDMKMFITANRGCVVLLSGVEYLVSQNGFAKVLKLLQHLNDKVAVTDSTLIVPVSPLTMAEPELKMLEKEMRSF